MDKLKATKMDYLLMAAIVLASFNMRGPMASVGPLASVICADLNISNAVAGLLTTLPLIAFAILSPFIAPASVKLGINRTMTYGLVAIFAGEIIRSYTGVAGLYIGTAVLGFGIDVGNVLIPGIIKLRFPNHIGIMTALFSSSMAVFAGLSSGFSYNIAADIGWREMLSVWSVLALAAIVLWIVLTVRDRKKPQAYGVSEKGRSLTRSGLAWKISLGMGVQALLYYSLISWVPSIFVTKGMDPVEAGYVGLIMQFVSLPMNFAVPLIAVRLKDQRKLALICCIVYAVGILGMLINGSPLVTYFFIVLLSLGMGTGMSYILTMVSLRTKDASEAARLSGMSQTIGYALAAVGPVLTGLLFDMTGSWTASVLMLFICLIALCLLEISAGKPGRV